jgi:hypothetical protein
MIGEGEAMNERRIRTVALLTGALLVALAPAFSQGQAKEPDLAKLAAGKEGKVVNRALSAADKDGRPAVRFDQRPGDGVAWWPDLVFGDGDLELDVRGKDEPQRSFLGIAFHGADEKTYDVVYFRPFNFRASDPERHKHAVQYISLPGYDWQKLRTEQPDKFEAPLPQPPDPNGWFHVRVAVRHPKVTVFVNGAPQPCLAVQQLSSRGKGWVGFWVGNGSAGEFANLRVSPAK